MTRVDENREAQRLDEKRRLEQQDEAKRKEASQSFERVVAEKKQASSKAGGERGQKQMGQKMAGDRQNKALMARAGIASQSLGSRLTQQGKQSLRDNEGSQKARSSEFKESERAGEAKQQRVELAGANQQAEQLAPISRDDRRGSGGGGSDSDAGSSQGEQHKGMFAGADPTAAMRQRELQGTASAQAAGGAQAPTMPPAMLREIVQRVLVGLNKEGLSEMHIQFKEGVLGGGSLQISSKDGKISAKFTVGDQNTKRLLRASQGELARAFDEKGLTLERFDVQSLV